MPSCKSCNSQKGNRHWREWLESSRATSGRISAIAQYIEIYGALTMSEGEMRRLAPEPFRRLDRLKEEILDRMREADDVAAQIRERVAWSASPSSNP